MKTTLSIGFNDKNTKKQEVTTSYAMRIVEDIIAMHVEGYTLYATKGGYKHIDGSTVRENGARVEIYGASVEDVKPAIEELKNALNQEAIAVEIVNDNTMFL